MHARGSFFRGSAVYRGRAIELISAPSGTQSADIHQHVDGEDRFSDDLREREGYALLLVKDRVPILTTLPISLITLDATYISHTETGGKNREMNTTLNGIYVVGLCRRANYRCKIVLVLIDKGS